MNTWQIETFVPLYINNNCDALCKICSMRSSNQNLHRIWGDIERIKQQLDILLHIEKISAVCFLSGEFRLGTHKRKKNFLLTLASIEAAFKMGFEIVYINIGSLTDEEIESLATKFPRDNRLVLSLFQETYDNVLFRKSFGKENQNNPKSDFQRRLSTPERWLIGGFSKLDMGLLLGLGELEPDIKKLVAHATKLYSKGAEIYISLPRLRGLKKDPYPIKDSDFIKTVKFIAESCSWAKVIVTTRESIDIICEILPWIKIVSPGTSDVLPYTPSGENPNSLETSQFQVAPSRPRPSWVLESLRLTAGSIRFFSK